MVVASGIFSVLKVVYSGTVFLGHPALQKAFALLRKYVVEYTFTRLEVVPHIMRRIVRTAFGEYGLAYFFAGRIGGTDSIYGIVAEVHINFGGIEFEVAIRYSAFAVHHCRVATYHHHRVLGGKSYGIVQVYFTADYTTRLRRDAVTHV